MFRDLDPTPLQRSDVAGGARYLTNMPVRLHSAMRQAPAY
jgi:hypothetical protein